MGPAASPAGCATRQWSTRRLELAAPNARAVRESEATHSSARPCRPRFTRRHRDTIGLWLVWRAAVRADRSCCRPGRPSALPGKKRHTFPSDWRAVFRSHHRDGCLPAYRSRLIPAPCRRITTAPSRTISGWMLFGCDRGGSPQAFHLDLKIGETRQLTEAEELDGGIAHAAAGQPLVLLLRRPLFASREPGHGAGARTVRGPGGLGPGRGNERGTGRHARHLRGAARRKLAAAHGDAVAGGGAHGGGGAVRDGRPHRAAHARADPLPAGRTRRYGWSIPTAHRTAGSSWRRGASGRPIGRRTARPSST